MSLLSIRRERRQSTGDRTGRRASGGCSSGFILVMLLFWYLGQSLLK
jgi:hypothetical protein